MAEINNKEMQPRQLEGLELQTISPNMPATPEGASGTHGMMDGSGMARTSSSRLLPSDKTDLPSLDKQVKEVDEISQAARKAPVEPEPIHKMEETWEIEPLNYKSPSLGDDNRGKPGVVVVDKDPTRPPVIDFVPPPTCKDRLLASTERYRVKIHTDLPKVKSIDLSSRSNDDAEIQNEVLKTPEDLGKGEASLSSVLTHSVRSLKNNDILHYETLTPLEERSEAERNYIQTASQLEQQQQTPPLTPAAEDEYSSSSIRAAPPTPTACPCQQYRQGNQETALQQVHQAPVPSAAPQTQHGVGLPLLPLLPPAHEMVIPGENVQLDEVSVTTSLTPPPSYRESLAYPTFQSSPSPHPPQLPPAYIKPLPNVRGKNRSPSVSFVSFRDRPARTIIYTPFDCGARSADPTCQVPDPDNGPRNIQDQFADHQILSLLACILFWPIGLIAIYYANMAEVLRSEGIHGKSIEYSQRALVLSMIAFIAGSGFYLLFYFKGSFTL